MPIEVHPEVQTALDEGRPVVALESTIFSRLGLPAPDNREALDRTFAAIRDGGAVPAVTCVLGGMPRIGVFAEDELGRILDADRKTAARDLHVAVAEGWDVGVTTVSATLALASAIGIRVFATGGIGGVHRDVARSGDVSADLEAIARSPVVTVTAGAKAFLDLARTLEHLESLSVPVLGWRTDEFPAFYSRSSGLAVPHRVDDAATAAAVLRARIELGPVGGVVLAVPVPDADAIPSATIQAAIAAANDDAAAAGITGAAVTPFVLERVAEATGGQAVRANLALAEHNATVAAEVASHLV